MYRAPSKQRQRIERLLIYGAMTATVVLLVTTLVFVMLGYRFNQSTSTIEQGGLVQFNTRPTGANVTVGSARLTDQTPSKITVNPADYTVNMTKEGYLDWTKSVEVQAGRVLWLNYAQLVPKTIETEQLVKFSAISDVLAAPNSERYALLAQASQPIIQLIDITSNEPKQSSITLPDDVLPANPIEFNLDTWASDSDRLLVTVKNDQAADWLFVDRRDAAKTINLSKKYGIEITEAVFDPRSNSRVIVRTNTGDVRIIDTEADTLSGVVASEVTDMSMYMDNAILLVQKTSPTTYSVGYISFGSRTVRQLQEVESSDTVMVAGSAYFGDPHISISNGAQLNVYQLRSLPSSGSRASISMTTLLTTAVPSNPTHLSIRSGGRFVLAQYGSGLLTYDVEVKKQSNTSFTKPVTEELRWLDRYHFYLTNGISLEVLEFDGGNAHSITALATPFDAILQSNGKYIYSFNSIEDNKFVLQRSKMILDN